MATELGMRNQKTGAPPAAEIVQRLKNEFSTAVKGDDAMGSAFSVLQTFLEKQGSPCPPSASWLMVSVAEFILPSNYLMWM